jgi:hypothetical protein
VRVSCKIVPAVKEAWYEQLAHCQSTERTGHAPAPPQRGQRELGLGLAALERQQLPVSLPFGIAMSAALVIEVRLGLVDGISFFV